MPEAAVRASKRKPLKSLELEVQSVKLGRFPFGAARGIYLKHRIGQWKESTLKETDKKLRYMERVFDELNAEERVSTMNPKKMVSLDILAFCGWMKNPIHGENKDMPLDPATQKKYLTTLKGFLTFWDNHVFDKMKSHGFRMPSGGEKPIKAFGMEKVCAIIESTRGLDNIWHRLWCKTPSSRMQLIEPAGRC